MKREFIFILLMICLFLTACDDKRRSSASQASVSPAPAEAPTFTANVAKPPFPASVDLAFSPVPLGLLKEGKPDPGWVSQQTIPFGAIGQQPVALYIYREPQQPDDFSVYKHALVHFEDRSYLVNNLISADLSDSPAAQSSTLFLLQHTFTYSNKQLVLLGGVELFSNGPGQVEYILYDRASNRWTSFVEWGKPQWIDLDSDGTDELAIQFEGLHNQSPDLSIYMWHNGMMEATRSLKSAVMGSTVQNYAMLEENRIISIGENNLDAPLAHYIYRQGRLVKQ